ncbi:hypothetical protein MMC28_000549 [Mycoblastus sanguinarius]|nr:hypothetical protein [Mycoblastus sanguinarius]
MIVHLENGGCSSGWMIQHINAIAADCVGFTKNLIRDRMPWFLAGAPRKWAYEGDYRHSGDYWICYLCNNRYPKDTLLTAHLQNEHSKDYPKVLFCPICARKFTKISSLLQHIETPRCSTTYDEVSIAALMQNLELDVTRFRYGSKQRSIQYRLECDSTRPRKLLVRVASADSLSDKVYRIVSKRKRKDDDEEEQREIDQWPEMPYFMSGFLNTFG